MTYRDSNLENVLEFHQAFGAPVGDAPKINDRAELRINLIEEELNELKFAIADNDIVETADALVDLIYVINGTIAEFGLHKVIGSLHQEVHRSNMSKLDDNGKPILREDGKILKSKNFTPPNLERLIFDE